MSSYEQRLEDPDRGFQYVLFACEPYETVGFKVPNEHVDKKEGSFFTNWDRTAKKFSCSFQFVNNDEEGSSGANPYLTASN